MHNEELCNTPEIRIITSAKHFHLVRIVYLLWVASDLLLSHGCQQVHSSSLSADCNLFMPLQKKHPLNEKSAFMFSNCSSSFWDNFAKISLTTVDLVLVYNGQKMAICFQMPFLSFVSRNFFCQSVQHHHLPHMLPFVQICLKSCGDM